MSPLEIYYVFPDDPPSPVLVATISVATSTKATAIAALTAAYQRFGYNIVDPS